MLKYRYNSLEDYLQSHPLDVDGLLDDGFGAVFPVKGRQIDAALLFADMTGFSSRSKHLSPTGLRCSPFLGPLQPLLSKLFHP